MTELIYKRWEKYLLLIILTLSFSCDKTIESVIPSIPFTLYINLSLHNEFNIPGNSVFIDGYGYGGVIVYCEQQGSFLAYDASCSHEATTSCIVENESITATCPCCGSEFILLGGYVSKGPASQPLRPYHTSYTNGTLRVYNY